MVHQILSDLAISTLTTYHHASAHGEHAGLKAHDTGMRGNGLHHDSGITKTAHGYVFVKRLPLPYQDPHNGDNTYHMHVVGGWRIESSRPANSPHLLCPPTTTSPCSEELAPRTSLLSLALLDALIHGPGDQMVAVPWFTQRPPPPPEREPWRIIKHPV